MVARHNRWSTPLGTLVVNVTACFLLGMLTAVSYTHLPGSLAHVRELVEGSVAVHLAHHQHRPVLTVPLAVVDWKEIRTPWER